MTVKALVLISSRILPLNFNLVQNVEKLEFIPDSVDVVMGFLWLIRNFAKEKIHISMLCHK